MVLPLAPLALLAPLFAAQIDVLSADKLDSATAPELALGDGDRFGQASTPLGDLNGDGRDELVVGLPFAGDGGPERGAIQILFLASDGSIETVQRISATAGGFGGEVHDGDQFGWSVAALDLNGDGRDELAVGARGDGDGGPSRGAVWILFLNADGSVSSHQKISALEGGFMDALTNGDQFGFALASPGDLDGDGRPELSIGATTAIAPGSIWPGDPTPVLIGQFPGFEPSGVVWNPVLQRMFVVSDEGRIARTALDGSDTVIWDLVGDLEGVTFIDPESPLIYVGRETPDAIIEFDTSTGLPTGEEWDLTPWMTGDPSEGLEALTYANGRFYAGHQGEGSIYVFELAPGGAVTFVTTLLSPLGLPDLAGLHYEASTDTLYALHDDPNRIVEMTLEGVFLRRYGIPGEDQEGFALVTNCPDMEGRVIVAQDSGELQLYSEYPTDCYGPGPIPGFGAFWNVFLNSDGSVASSVRVGLFSGGFSGLLNVGDRFGAALAPLGDLDGNGVPDLAVSAPLDDTGGLDRGAVYTLRLGPDGRVLSHAKISSGAGVTALEDNDQFGWALASAGDIDGDGRNELAAGLPGSDAGGTSRGGIELLYLDAAGLVTQSQRFDATTPSLAAGLHDFDLFGGSLAGPIDLDGDSVADLVAGAPCDNTGGPKRGAVWELDLDGAVLPSVTPLGCDADVTGTLTVLAGAPSVGSTLQFGLDNPFGTQPAGSLPVVVLALSQDPNAPCGTPIPGWGMASPGASGELLLGLVPALIVPYLFGAPWAGSGSPAPVTLVLPPSANLIGLSVYAQGALLDLSGLSGIPIGLTNALALVLGE